MFFLPWFALFADQGSYSCLFTAAQNEDNFKALNFALRSFKIKVTKSKENKFFK